MLFPLAVSGIIRHTPSSGSRLSGLGRHGKSRLDLYIDNLNFGDLIFPPPLFFKVLISK